MRDKYLWTALPVKSLRNSFLIVFGHAITAVSKRKVSDSCNSDATVDYVVTVSEEKMERLHFVVFYGLFFNNSI